METKKYLSAMKTMVEMEKMISRVRPDKYKAVCKKHGIDEHEAMDMYGYLQKMKTDYWLVSYKKEDYLEQVLVIGEEAYSTYLNNSFAYDATTFKEGPTNILMAFRKEEKTFQQDFDLQNPNSFFAITEIMNSGYHVVCVARQVDNVDSKRYKGDNEEKKPYIPIYDGDVMLCYVDDPESYFSDYKNCGLYICQDGVYLRLIYTPGKGYVRHGELDTDEDFELDIDNDAFSHYIMTLHQNWYKLGNIHAGIGFLIEESK